MFDALSHGYVKAIQVFVTTDVDDPHSVLEKYIFKFSYAGDGNEKSQRVHGIEVLSPARSLVVSAIESFKEAVTTLMLELQSMPPLPGT